MLNKILFKLQYDSESAMKLHEDRLLKEKEKQNKHTKIVVRKSKTQMKHARKEKDRSIKLLEKELMKKGNELQIL